MVSMYPSDSSLHLIILEEFSVLLNRNILSVAEVVCSSTLSISTVSFKKFSGEETTMAFIYINGYPGVGKFTVAKELMHVCPSLLAATLANSLISFQEAYPIIETC